MIHNQIQPEYIRKMRRKISINRIKKKVYYKYPDLINCKFNDIKTRFSMLYTDVAFLI